MAAASQNSARTLRLGKLVEWMPTRTVWLVRNAAWNLSGSFIPMIAAVAVLPVILSSIGKESFGVLSLILALVGYFSVLDLGLGRALTKLVAEKQAAGKRFEQCEIVWTGMAVLAALGSAAFLIVLPFAGLIAKRFLSVGPALQSETQTALKIAAAMMPLVLWSSALRGVLEGRQAFRRLNHVRVAMGLLTTLAPVAVLKFWNTLPAFVSILAAARLVTCVLYARTALKLLPELKTHRKIDPRVAKLLFHFGGWMTVSNVVSPALVYLDRFVITSIISLSAVAYYVTPFEAVTKLLYLSSAFAAVLFPSFSALSCAFTRQELHLEFVKGLRTVAIVLAPAVLFTLAAANPILRIWLGRDFSEHSTIILRILAVGVLLNGIASVPFAFIQGVGRPDLTAKSHLAQLVPYVTLCGVATAHFGISGTAVAWSMRALIDLTILLALVHRHMPRLGELPKQKYQGSSAGVESPVVDTV